jgi:hypothetical protein
MPDPTRETTGGRVYNDLRNLAKREGPSSADIMLSYALERFLHRLARAPEGGRHFVLKGGLLLAQFGARRHTRWRGKQDADQAAYPASFAEICATVIAFADPLLTGTSGVHWSAADRQWH